jgi:hypothetical protein
MHSSYLVLVSAMLGMAPMAHPGAARAGSPISPPGSVSVVTAPDSTEPAEAADGYGRLPLSFEANRGQTDDQVRFVSRGGGHNLFLTPTEAVMVIDRHRGERSSPRDWRAGRSKMTEGSTTVLRMHLVGANPRPRVTGLNELPGKANYFIGSDPTKWRTNVATYAKVKYENVYPGVDLVYYGNQQQLEYDLVIAPVIDPQVVTLGFEGADSIEIDSQGDLILRTRGGEIRQKRPLVYQEIAGIKKTIAARYLLKGVQGVSFQVADHDITKPLIVDPVLIYSTYLDGSGGSAAFDIAVDAQGHAYVTGNAFSADFPTADPLQGFQGSIMAFVTKLTPQGSGVVYSTFLGGSGESTGSGIAVDAVGNAYVTGATSSADFPTVHALQPQLHGAKDVFVAKIDAQGSALVYSTYLGGSGDDAVAYTRVAVDVAGHAYVAGATDSADFPTKNALQPALAGGLDAFVAKLNVAGSDLIYSTYLGGTGDDFPGGMAVDGSGNAYVTGQTVSPDFPMKNAFQPALAGSPSADVLSPDAFITKLSAEGHLVYSTYLGGSGFDFGAGIAVDATGNAYITGLTQSPGDFPVKGPLQVPVRPDLSQASAFVTKLTPEGSALAYSTHLGSATCCAESGIGIAVDATGSAYVAGFTIANDFPVTMGAPQTSPGGQVDHFVVKLDSAGSSLLYSTYLGGQGPESPPFPRIAVDASGSAYVAGITRSSDFPTTPGAFQTTPFGSVSAYVTKLSNETVPLQFVTFPPDMPALPPTAAVGVSYVGNIGIGGDAPPYSFTVVGGSLPPGLSFTSGGGVTVTTVLPEGGALRAVTSDSPVITGVPTRCGTSEFTVNVFGRSGTPITSTAPFSIRVSDPLGHTQTITSAPGGTPNPVASAGTTALSVTVADSLGHPVHYNWTASCPSLPAAGTFSDPTMQTPTWTAPANTTGAEQSCTLNVRADDGDCLTRTSFTQLVAAAVHTLTLTTGPTGAPNRVPPAGTSSLSVAATDSLGHALSYAWTASCPTLPSPGTFSTATGQDPTWTAPVNSTGAPQTCTLQVTVSDGQGLIQVGAVSLVVVSVAHTLTITAGPTSAANPVASEGTAILSVTAADSLGHALSYVWTAACPSLPSNGTFSDPTVQNPAWTAPVNPTGGQQTCTLQVMVSDGQDLTQSATVSLAVNGPTLLQPLVAAVLPTSRSVQVGTPATAFVTLINAGTTAATAVGIALASPIAATFAFQTTDPLTNHLTGTTNAPIDIPAGHSQSFVVSLTPTAAFAPADVTFTFAGSNTVPVPPLVGINTLLLCASSTPVPDIVALAATETDTGIVTVPAVNATGVFAVATVNVGAGARITASADSGASTLPITITLCQANPLTSDCTSPPGPTVTTQIGPDDTSAFGVFVTAQGPVPFDPARGRVFVRFRDADGIERGATSVAVRTP